MNEAFEKILERIDSYIEDAKSEGDFSYIKPFEIAKIAVQEVAEEHNVGWIPIDEKLPPDDNFILLSFSNFSIPIVGRYEEDEDGGGNFFAGDEDEPLISQDMYVNAWMPLPKCYEER